MNGLADSVVHHHGSLRQTLRLDEWHGTNMFIRDGGNDVNRGNVIHLPLP
jgi:hypothetical protein